MRSGCCSPPGCSPALGAGNIAAAQAYVSDVTTPETRAKGMGMIGAAFGLGFTIGPALGGLVAGANPTAAALARPAFLAAGLSAVALVIALARLKESLPASGAPCGGAAEPLAPGAGRDDPAGAAPPHRAALRHRHRLCRHGDDLRALGARAPMAGDRASVGYNFLYVGLVLVAVQGGLIGRLSKRFGETRLVHGGRRHDRAGPRIPAFCARAVAALDRRSACSRSAWGCSSPSITSLISQQAEIDERGGVLGVSQSAAACRASSARRSPAPLFEFWGRNAPYYVGAVVMALVVALAVRLPRARVRRSAMLALMSSERIAAPKLGSGSEVGLRQELKALRRLAPYLWPRDCGPARAGARLARRCWSPPRASMSTCRCSTRARSIGWRRAMRRLITVPVALIIGYGLARVGAQLFAELRDAVFAKVGQRAVRARGARHLPPSPRAVAALPSRPPDRRPVARHRARHPRHRVPALLHALQRRADADRDRCWSAAILWGSTGSFALVDAGDHRRATSPSPSPSPTGASSSAAR